MVRLVGKLEPDVWLSGVTKPPAEDVANDVLRTRQRLACEAIKFPTKVSKVSYIL